MRKKLHSLYGLFAILLLALPWSANAQINYSADFNTGTNGWDFYNFSTTNVATCNGGGAARVNLYFDMDTFEGNFDAEAISPSIGTSNGLPITISYKYKVVNYSTGNPTVPTPAESEFGIIELAYATSVTGEFTTIETIDSSNQVTSASCTTRTVTITVPAGSPVYLDFYTELNDISSDVFVYIDEVTATQPAIIACTGTPPASVTVAASGAVCSTQAVSLSLSPAYVNTGITYQWQTSADGITYVNAGTGNTAASYTAPQTASTYYRALVSCSAGGDTVTSTPVLITSTGLPCPCTIDFTEDVEPITLVNFAGINNASSATVDGTPALQDFTGITPAQVIKGQSYFITLKGNTNGPEYQTYFRVYIDFNHNGNLNDPGESFNAGSVTGSTGNDAQQAVTQITIPASAMTGLTAMRVIKNYDEYPITPCLEYEYGQAEDYLINISGVSGCTTAPAASAIVALNTVVCQGQNTTLSLSTTYTNGETIKWQISADNVIFTDIPGATMPVYQTTQTATSYYRAVVTCVQANLSVTTASILIQTQISAAPTAGTAAVFCNNATISDLSGTVNGTAILWYTAATGGQALAGTASVSNGTYYASQTINGCESAQRLAVPVTITNTPVPVPGVIPPVFCSGATVADLVAQIGGEAIKIYTTQTGGALLGNSTVLTNASTYYASQTINACESNRIAVTVTITVVPQPEIPSPQTISNPLATILDIEVNGIDSGTVTFYLTPEDALNGTNPLAADVPLNTQPTVYYAVQTLNGCNSEVIQVTINTTVMQTGSFDNTAFRFYPNPVTGILNLQYRQPINIVEFYNIIGQQVLVKSVNATNAAIDVSRLAAGTYVVKIMAGITSKNIRVVVK